MVTPGSSILNGHDRDVQRAAPRLGQGTNRDGGNAVPENRSRSTGPLTPGTVPALECCQNVQPLPPQPPAGTMGSVAVVQFALPSTGQPFRAHQSESPSHAAQKRG